MHEKPESWRKFEKGLCASCVANCCREWPVAVTVPDLIRLDYLSEEIAATSLKKAVGVLKRKGILKSFEPSLMVGILEQRENRDCIFLHETERRCTVYSRRPEICRQFPKIGLRPNHCPYETK